MSLTDNQKAVLRLVIEQNPSPSYMEQLASDDEFALDEIELHTPELILLNETVKANILNQLESLQSHLAQVENKLVILQGE